MIFHSHVRLIVGLSIVLPRNINSSYELMLLHLFDGFVGSDEPNNVFLFVGVRLL